MGTASPARQFPASANSREYSPSARRSWTWAILPSNTARPASTERSGRLGYIWERRFRSSGVKLFVAVTCRRSPSYRKTPLNTASHRRAALSTIAPNTGCASVGDRVMTLSTSHRRSLMFERFREVARARLHLVEQPHVLDRDHRLVSKGRNQLDLLVG